MKMPLPDFTRIILILYLVVGSLLLLPEHSCGQKKSEDAFA